MIRARIKPDAPWPLDDKWYQGKVYLFHDEITPVPRHPRGWQGVLGLRPVMTDVFPMTVIPIEHLDIEEA